VQVARAGLRSRAAEKQADKLQEQSLESSIKFKIQWLDLTGHGVV
jgi:hypothetical protein